MRALLAVLMLASACADVPQPFELDHARVLAVRIDPPALPPGGTARIDVLITDSSSSPRVATPDLLSVRLPAEIGGAGDQLIARTETGWQVTAPDAATIAAIRARSTIAPEAPLVIALEIDVDTLDARLHATKTLAIGEPATNPAAPTILLDGSAGALTAHRGTTMRLAVAAPDPEHDYRWFSSIGDLTGFTRPEADLDPSDVAGGVLVVVERDQVGGTAWAIAAAAVAP